jgi:hypothetical protein
MSNLKLKIWMLSMLLVFAACTKDIVDTTGNISGIVSDAYTQQPLTGASVTISPLGKSYTTGSDGRYEFQNIEAQEYSVQVTKTNYQTNKKTITVSAGQDATLDFQLTPSSPLLSVSQTTLDFGADATTLTFNIYNTGNAPLTWQVSEDVAWLNCSPTSGSINKEEQVSVIVNVDRTGLDRGNYAQTLAISSNGGSAVIRINMTVRGFTMSVSPEALDFGSSITALNLALTNTGSGNITYSLSTSNDWIRLNKTSGTFSSTDNVTVSVDRTNRAEGDYNGEVIIAVGDYTISVPVRMNIPVKEKPTAALYSIDDITYNGATIKAAVVSIGSATVTSHGLCWNTSGEPTLNDASCNLGDCTTAKDFTYNLSSLAASTTYYVRAYAINVEGTSYSNQSVFTTKGTPQKAGVETGNVTEVQAEQAQVGGNITHMGNLTEISQYGHVWSLRPDPTLADAKTQLGKAYTTGAYVSTLTDLTAATTYHVRAYATNSVGTSYGEDITFTTGIGSVRLQTAEVSAIDYYEATCGGTITATGGNTILACGICWAQGAAPTVGNETATATLSGSTFTARMTGLEENTAYHVRAYVQTADGQIYYGNDVAFSTRTRAVVISKDGFPDENNWTR